MVQAGHRNVPCSLIILSHIYRFPQISSSQESSISNIRRMQMYKLIEDGSRVYKKVLKAYEDSNAVAGSFSYRL